MILFETSCLFCLFNCMICEISLKCVMCSLVVIANVLVIVFGFRVIWFVSMFSSLVFVIISGFDMLRVFFNGFMMSV